VLQRRPLALGSSGDGGLGVKPHPAAFAERAMRCRVEKMQPNQKGEVIMTFMTERAGPPGAPQ